MRGDAAAAAADDDAASPFHARNVVVDDDIGHGERDDEASFRYRYRHQLLYLHSAVACHQTDDGEDVPQQGDEMVRHLHLGGGDEAGISKRFPMPDDEEQHQHGGDGDDKAATMDSSLHGTLLSMVALSMDAILVVGDDAAETT
mmetsp:Transcript_3403/g.4645  ORF Transcript_3403/g.4645 Transcript_3403/m.4645 type:complete len:144 (-) Transcript_3403:1472-1903(-)